MNTKQTQTSNNSSKLLFEEIKAYKLKQYFVGIALIVVGLLGLILPILPGWVLIFAGLLLFFPRWGKKVIKKLHSILKIDSSKMT